MMRTILILAVVGSILAPPLLCDAGVAAHECVCDTSDCCVEETACDLDPCNDLYNIEDWRRQHNIMAAAAALSLVGLDVSAAEQTSFVPSEHNPSQNRPFPDSDLPLRI